MFIINIIKYFKKKFHDKKTKKAIDKLIVRTNIKTVAINKKIKEYKKKQMIKKIKKFFGLKR